MDKCCVTIILPALSIMPRVIWSVGGKVWKTCQLHFMESLWVSGAFDMTRRQNAAFEVCLFICFVSMKIVIHSLFCYFEQDLTVKYWNVPLSSRLLIGCPYSFCSVWLAATQVATDLFVVFIQQSLLLNDLQIVSYFSVFIQSKELEIGPSLFSAFKLFIFLTSDWLQP